MEPERCPDCLYKVNEEAEFCPCCGRRLRRKIRLSPWMIWGAIAGAFLVGVVVVAVVLLRWGRPPAPDPRLRTERAERVKTLREERMIRDVRVGKDNVVEVEVLPRFLESNPKVMTEFSMLLWAWGVDQGADARTVEFVDPTTHKVLGRYYPSWGFEWERGG